MALVINNFKYSTGFLQYIKDRAIVPEMQEYRLFQDAIIELFNGIRPRTPDYCTNQLPMAKSTPIVMEETETGWRLAESLTFTLENVCILTWGRIIYPDDSLQDSTTDVRVDFDINGPATKGTTISFSNLSLNGITKKWRY
ncbi:MAG: hypothetical protein KKD44_29205 [Proteobacteria bacterium]|nr:hypothetical protein [Pseudomonadota bacterium]